MAVESRIGAVENEGSESTATSDTTRKLMFEENSDFSNVALACKHNVSEEWKKRDRGQEGASYIPLEAIQSEMKRRRVVVLHTSSNGLTMQQNKMNHL